ncbi:MAG TPA: HD domain-containing protein [Dissulfurispiraceae bacterium]|nr:HD domain-containing protein [Dissulfurispiraceae bacterium]
MNVNALSIIEKYYQPGSESHYYLTEHSKAVARMSLEIARRLEHLNPDYAFIEEAALLHDIGIFQTDLRKIGCFGPHPYICHGYLGRVILESEGLPTHALVCERHVGVGLGCADIIRNAFPLPLRDMLPLSLEEQIICFADKFYSKDKTHLTSPRSTEKVMKMVSHYGDDKVRIFETWLRLFSPDKS